MVPGLGKYGRIEIKRIEQLTALTPFEDVYKDRVVLVTGHTGFKGSWLAAWLTLLGAKVVGFSAYLPSIPCNFVACNLEEIVVNIQGDVRDINSLSAVFSEYEPEIVFHLAAQPLVKESYSDPKLTFDTNVGGTINILECIRSSRGLKAAVIITSDKCYQNFDWLWGYRENDKLGGSDPYSASKACAELVFYAYVKSFFSGGQSVRICTTRAGNVIGGGDWAEARIVPDCVRAWSEGKKVFIRNPDATRPWQHVLEPLSGYLWLGANLLKSHSLHGESFNFGPAQSVNKSVRELIESFLSVWGAGGWKHEAPTDGNKENVLLKLCCDKALHLLNWHPVLSFDETIHMTAEWYKAFYDGNTDMCDFTFYQIRNYIFKAVDQGLVWVRETLGHD